MNWNVRDEKLSDAVNAFAGELRSDSEGKEHLTKTEIARAVGCPSLLKHLKRLPLTASILEKVLERAA